MDISEWTSALDSNYSVGDVLAYFDRNIDRSKTSVLLDRLLTSHAVLTLSPRGEIVYRSRIISNTNTGDLVKYCVSEYGTDIPESTGLDVLMKGLAAVKIDKILVDNARV